ncbi:MAG: bifunctional alpha,alpha-trehalose-phosphate synthase (UDP-forming)/trehalose-phosphatase, partial [Coriobacteriales bacterium]
MSGRVIIVANRLPVSLSTDENGNDIFVQSTGGLATALGQLHAQEGSLWVGSSDIPAEEKNTQRASNYESELSKSRCVPVYLTKDEVHGFYEQYSNSAIWPLFHDFPQYVRFNHEYWKTYMQVNRKFCDAVLEHANPDDTIWVQDYHLMLLPKMLREALPDALIGFFLHIPFPDYETFRMLPERREVLEGLLGADLIGFHTYDYIRHFLSSCGRILGLENRMGSLLNGSRLVQVDVFPLGIDYERFASQGRAERTAEIIEQTEVGKPRGQTTMKNIVSVDRLDYTKGIPELLRAYDAFLDRYPEWQGKVRLSLLAVPSRETVAAYTWIKREVDELVGKINGKYALADWVPIRYYYRSLPFEQLCALYRSCDVMLVTPLRDGMNLVSKEYLAVHDGGTGVLVLSEMAGAAGELSEALLVNPFDRDSIVEALHKALTMPEEEQRHRNSLMQRRLSRYTSDKWAEEF